LFIVIEGIDGTGKTTLCRFLEERLVREGYDVVITAEPTGGPIGELIRRKGFDPRAEALLFAADRSCHTADINEWLSRGKVVISDRYYVSSLAYQGASHEGMTDWIAMINEPVIREPDVTVVLDIDPEEGLGRISSRGENSRFETVGYLARVRENYLRIARERGYRVMDASRDRNETLDEIMKMIREE
jgi:dTMP kinase